jgi:hypothetical protein
LQKKPRRTSSGEPKQGRKSKSGGEEKAEKRKLKTLPEGSADKEVKEEMHKLEADGPMNEDVHLVREFERERAETEKAQRIWDGKVHTKKKSVATEGSEAYLNIKSSVVSSVAGTEETPDGVRVREVVKRSTLLPIPSGDESEVEEVVTRTKLLSAKGDFTSSDQELLRTTYRKKPLGQFKNLLRNDSRVLVLRIIALLVTLCSILLILYSRR